MVPTPSDSVVMVTKYIKKNCSNPSVQRDFDSWFIH